MDKLSKIAFTLIELLVVIAIIGILSGLIVVTMNGVTAKANIAKSQVFSNSLRNSLMMNLVSEWKFNGSGVSDGSHLTADYAKDSWGINDATSSSSYATVLSGSNCVEGSCVQLNNGNYGYLYSSAVNLNPGTGSLTVEGWVYATDYTYPRTRFPFGDYAGSGTPCWAIDDSYYSNGIGILFSDGTNRFDNVMALDSGYRPTNTLNKWAHIVASFDRTAGRIYIYVNGKKQSNYADISSVTGNVYNPSNRVQVGNAAGWILYGRVDNVRIYNIATPASFVKEQYYSGLNSLFLNGGITKEEYLSRLNDYASNN